MDFVGVKLENIKLQMVNVINVVMFVNLVPLLHNVILVEIMLIDKMILVKTVHVKTDIMITVLKHANNAYKNVLSVLIVALAPSVPQIEILIIIAPVFQDT